MNTIPLTKGQSATVDDSVFEYYSKFRWSAIWNKGTESYYAMRSDGERIIYLHREIMGSPKGMIVDHKNHDTLDCREDNLRVCSKSQNMANRSGLDRNNKSGFRGVHWDPMNKKWRAEISVNKNKIKLGRFTEKMDAARAYSEANKLYFGEFGGAIA